MVFPGIEAPGMQTRPVTVIYFGGRDRKRARRRRTSRHKSRQKAEPRGAAIKHMIKQRNGLETRSWCKERERERRVHLPSRITDHTCFGKPVDICSHEAYMPAPTSPHVASLLNTVIFRGSSLPTRPLSGGSIWNLQTAIFLGGCSSFMEIKCPGSPHMRIPYHTNAHQHGAITHQASDITLY